LEQRRARQALWAFRLTFYPAVIVGAVLLLASRSNGAAPVWLDGTTSQGAHVQGQLVDGRVARLLVSVNMRCPGGNWAVSWSPRPENGELQLRETTGHHYRFHNQTGRRTMTLDGRLEDGALSGTVTAVEHFDEPGYGPYDCASGPITFSARELSTVELRLGRGARLRPRGVTRFVSAFQPYGS
jgi:hypothetical protein